MLHKPFCKSQVSYMQCLNINIPKNKNKCLVKLRKLIKLQIVVSFLVLKNSLKEKSMRTVILILKTWENFIYSGAYSE